MSIRSITKQVVELLGGQVAVAEITGVKQQTVGYWVNKSGKIPAEYVRPIEAELRKRGATITRYEIRPDVYGPRSEVDAA
ncbi:YdaS family helix-turn-helix protein [Gilvimarinus agarilyticus]|uniref:YdaS family helix-turn-helix protein n=1 Tax=Gilvimarinus agarilyticus TaxID=679259 RepID=UPI0005A2CB35|nr:YdaS family helix-turn-helix protein [Gilvimarinus agarilyticus]